MNRKIPFLLISSAFLVILSNHFVILSNHWSFAKLEDSEEEPYTLNLAKWTTVSTTSTCGATPEVFCILTGTGTKRDQDCGVCDKNKFRQSHPIIFATDGTERWWKSENYVHGVNITMSLGQEFYIAYVVLKMGRSPRPGNWILERSTDFGRTYKVWQYFGMTVSDCFHQYGIYPKSNPTYDEEVICSTQYSSVTPLEYGEIHLNLLKGRPGAETFYSNTKLQEWIRATNIRLRFERIRTLHGDLMMIVKNDKTVTRRYFYSIRDISIGGRCICYGHADTCIRDEKSGSLQCRCNHNTCGPSCSTCCPGFQQMPWKPGTPDTDTTDFCEACNCFNHASQCYFNETVANLRQSINTKEHYEGGGVCVDCQHNTTGVNCEKCKKGCYRPDKKSHYDWDACKECECNMEGSLDNICDHVGGQCRCKQNVAGQFCDRCVYGMWNFPNCQDCKCQESGSYSKQCHPITGQCRCKPGVEGRHCEICDRRKDKYPYPEVSLLTHSGCMPCGYCSMVLLNETTYHGNLTMKALKLSEISFEDLVVLRLATTWRKIWDYQDMLESMVDESGFLFSDPQPYELSSMLEVEERNSLYFKNAAKMVFMRAVTTRDISIKLVDDLRVLIWRRLGNLQNAVHEHIVLLDSIASFSGLVDVRTAEMQGKRILISMQMFGLDDMWSKALSEMKEADKLLNFLSKNSIKVHSLDEKLTFLESNLNKFIPDVRQLIDGIFEKSKTVYEVLAESRPILKELNESHNYLWMISNRLEDLIQRTEEAKRLKSKADSNLQIVEQKLWSAHDTGSILMDEIEDWQKQDLKEYLPKIANHLKALWEKLDLIKRYFPDEVLHPKSARKADAYTHIKELIRGSLDSLSETYDIIDLIYKLPTSKNLKSISILLRKLAYKVTNHTKIDHYIPLRSTTATTEDPINFTTKTITNQTTEPSESSPEVIQSTEYPYTDTEPEPSVTSSLDIPPEILDGDVEGSAWDSEYDHDEYYEFSQPESQNTAPIINEALKNDGLNFTDDSESSDSEDVENKTKGIFDFIGGWFGDQPYQHQNDRLYQMPGEIPVLKENKESKEKFRKMVKSEKRKVDLKWNEHLLKSHRMAMVNKKIHQQKNTKNEINSFLESQKSRMNATKMMWDQCNVDTLKQICKSSSDIVAKCNDKSNKLKKGFQMVKDIRYQSKVSVKQVNKMCDEKIPYLKKTVRSFAKFNHFIREKFPALRKEIDKQKRALHKKLKLASKLASKIKSSYHFSKPGFIEMWPLPSLVKTSLTTDIRISLKPQFEDGLIMQFGNYLKPNDTSLVLELSAGKPKLTIYSKNNKPVVLKHFEHVSMYVWNTISLQRIGRKYSMTLLRTNETDLVTSVTLEQRVDLKSFIDGPIFIGGQPDDEFPRQTSDFEGCMSEPIINNKEIGFLGSRRTRGVQSICTEDIDGVHDIGEATFGGHGFINLLNERHFKLNPLNLELRFKTTQGNATLLFLSEQTEVIQLLVQLVNGRLISYFLDQSEACKSGRSMYNDGYWHHIKIERKRHISKLTVDKLDRRTAKSLPWSYGNRIDMFYVGGIPRDISQHIRLNTRAPFRGCMTDLKLDGMEMTLSNFKQAYDVTFNGCRQKWMTNCLCGSNSEAFMNLKKSFPFISHIAFSLKITTTKRSMIFSYTKSMNDGLTLYYKKNFVFLNHTNTQGGYYDRKLKFKLADGQWHDLVLLFDYNSTVLSIDGSRLELHAYFDSNVWPSEQLVTFGYNPQIQPNAQSRLCFKDIIINESLVNMNTEINGENLLECKYKR